MAVSGIQKDKRMRVMNILSQNKTSLILFLVFVASGLDCN